MAPRVVPTGTRLQANRVPEGLLPITSDHLPRNRATASSVSGEHPNDPSDLNLDDAASRVNFPICASFGAAQESLTLRRRSSVLSDDLHSNGPVAGLERTPSVAKNALKKEGSYNTGAYANLVLPYTKKEVTASYSSGNQSLYGDLEVLTDGTYKYNSKANKVNGTDYAATHDDLPTGAIREELFSFTDENGFVFYSNSKSKKGKSANYQRNRSWAYFLFC